MRASHTKPAPLEWEHFCFIWLLRSRWSDEDKWQAKMEWIFDNGYHSQQAEMMEPFHRMTRQEIEKMIIHPESFTWSKPDGPIPWLGDKPRPTW